MGSNHGLFHVIVLGGIGLIAADACGGVARDSNGGGTGAQAGSAGSGAAPSTGGFG